MRHRDAFTCGRFNLLTNGHVAMIEHILRQWPKVVIAVLDLDEPREPSPAAVANVRPEYLDRITDKTAPAHNPFDADERIAMWRAALKAAGLNDRASYTTVPIPELFPEQINERFPPDSYDIVFGDTTADTFDVLKAAELRRILARDVTNVHPPFVLHATQAKKRVAAGEPWSALIAPGALDVFEAIGGPHRLSLV